MTIWTAAFWKALVERVLSTFLQAFGGALLAALTDVNDPHGIDWSRVLLGAAFGAGLAVLKSLLANAITKNGPSFTDAEQVVPPEPQPV